MDLAILTVSDSLAIPPAPCLSMRTCNTSASGMSSPPFRRKAGRYQTEAGFGVVTGVAAADVTAVEQLWRATM